MRSPEVLTDLMMNTYRRWPVEFVWGSGCRLEDKQGNSYLDLIAGIGVCGVGHAHPHVAAAIVSQAFRLLHVSNLYYNGPQLDLAKQLSAWTLDKRVFFGNSGSEAIECAIKLARRWATKQRGPRAVRIICAEGGFHGRTFGSLAATGQPSKQAPFAPMLEGFTHVPYGDEAALEAAMDDDVAAVLIEPIQGEAGVIAPPLGYVASARTVCDRYGVLLMLDEIQTGVGRTGLFLAAEHEAVDADVVCLAKSLAGGLPIGACLARPEVAAAFEPGDHASTFGGGPVVCAAALAVLELIENDGLLARATAGGERLFAGLQEIAPPGAEVRGRGLLIGVDLGEDRARSVVEKALAEGILINDVTPSVVRFSPPLVISDEEIDFALEKLQGILK